MRTIERQLRARQTAVSLNEKELSRLMKATFDTPRLEQVRDLFIFSSFTGLHYQNLKSLRKENFHSKYGQKWIFMVREQTDAFIHIPLLPVPQMILEKYKVRYAGTDELLPVPSNQRLNVYLKEIAELCGIEKNMTMYLAYHTFKDTITTKNGISTGTVCRMLGRFDLRGRHAYVTDRIIKREMDRVARNCTPFEKIAAQYIMTTNKSVYCPTK